MYLLTSLTQNLFDILFNRYMYCDEVQLEADTVLATLYVAKKYMVPHLARACVNYLETSLTARNACLLLSQSRLFEEPDLMQRCWEVIDAQVSLDKKMVKSFTLNDNLHMILKTNSSSYSDDTNHTVSFYSCGDICLNKRLKDSQHEFTRKTIKSNNNNNKNIKDQVPIISHCLSSSENDCFSLFSDKRLSFSLFRTRSEPYFMDNKLEIEVTQNITYEDNFLEEYEHNKKNYGNFQRISRSVNATLS